MLWDDATTAKACKLWDQGLSASQIEARLGGSVTRSAVLGKLNRLGKLGGRKATKKAMAKPRTASRRMSALTGLYAHLAGDGQSMPLPEAPPSDVPTVHSVQDLKEHHCRWPVGDPRDAAFGFCGAHRAPGVSYCTHHARVSVASTSVDEAKAA